VWLFLVRKDKREVVRVSPYQVSILQERPLALELIAAVVNVLLCVVVDPVANHAAWI
jgi:hypothetical protein